MITTTMTTTNAKFIANHVVLAPMVRGSEKAFRMLVRHIYPGGLTCYSPMLPAVCVVDERGPNTTNKTGKLDDNLYPHDLQDDQDDGPLIVQLCDHQPDQLFQAAKRLMQRFCSPHNNNNKPRSNQRSPLVGLDFNLGCPHTCARVGNYGAFLAEQNPDLAVECVKAMKRAIVDAAQIGQVQLSCKIRLQDTMEQTIAVCQRLVRDGGCDALTVHLRCRTAKFDGDADLEAGRQVVTSLKSDPTTRHAKIILNGAHVQNLDQVRNIMQQTGCDRVMLARIFLVNPYVLHPTQPRPEAMALQYIQFAQRYPPPTTRYLQKHVQWFLSHTLVGTTPEKGAKARILLDPAQNWRHRLDNFLHRPYLTTLEQWRDVVRLYVHLLQEEQHDKRCDDGDNDECNLTQDPYALHLPVPTYQSIRNHDRCTTHSIPQPVPT